MEKQAELFLASFNRIEKWLQNEYEGSQVPGFAELVRRLSQRKDLLVRQYRDDLLEIAQLRNAIVHDRISPTFVIAEPNEWIVNKIIKIEDQLTRPEQVIPTFQKKVTKIEQETPLTDLLEIVQQKGFMQFPVYQQTQFKGVITSKGIGLWLANHLVDQKISVANQSVRSVLKADKRRNNYRFISKETFVFQALEIFVSNPTIEVILITEDGQEDRPLLGLIRPKDIFNSYYEEWRK